MACSEQDRFKLHDRLGEVLGRDVAATLMASLPPIGWSDLATKDDVRVLEAKLEALEGRLDLKMANQMRMIVVSVAGIFAGYTAIVVTLFGILLSART